MVGLSVSISFESERARPDGGTLARSTTTSEDLKRTLSARCLDDRYDATVHHDRGGCFVGSATYPSYPLTTFETASHRVCLEGALYDVPPERLKDEVLAVSEFLFEGALDRVNEWVFDRDGEFVVVAVEKETGRVAICNDALGRLPVYWHEAEGGVTVSRDLAFITETTVRLAFDRMAVAQYLSFGYPLGDRTLLEGVRRLPPASIVRVDPSDADVTVEQHHQFRYDEPSHHDRTAERNAWELARRFTDACRRRAADDRHPVVSLSGGLDSRAVLVGLANGGVDCSAATMRSPMYVPDSDVSVASEIAAAHGVDWRSYPLEAPTGRDLSVLLEATDGLNPLGNAHIVQFFEALLEAYHEPITYVTGDGGDKVLPDLTPSRSLGSADDLLGYVVAENGLFSLDDVASLTGVSKQELLASVRRLLESYPESSHAGRYVHFLIHERGMNYLFEGEDRNRHFAWSVAPFWSLPVFRYAMNCPVDQKGAYGLYGDFLDALSPAAARIDRSDYGVPPDSYRHVAAVSLQRLLERHPSLIERVKPFARKLLGLETESHLDSNSVRCVNRQRQRCDAIDGVLSPSGLERVLAAPDGYGIEQWYTLFTITSFVENATTDSTSLASFADASFV